MSRLEEFMHWMGLARSTVDDGDSSRSRTGPEKFQVWLVDHSRAIQLTLAAYIVVVVAVAGYATAQPGESALALWALVTANLVVAGLIVLVTLPTAKRRVAERESRQPGTEPPR